MRRPESETSIDASSIKQSDHTYLPSVACVGFMVVLVVDVDTGESLSQSKDTQTQKHTKNPN